jgi:hypothetical protein
VVGATTKTTSMEVRWSTAAMHDDNGGEKKCKGRRLARCFFHKESSSRI